VKNDAPPQVPITGPTEFPPFDPAYHLTAELLAVQHGWNSAQAQRVINEWAESGFAHVMTVQRDGHVVRVIDTHY
jgi:hypothetical protein